jgi:orotate phosphoribosyltransferase
VQATILSFSGKQDLLEGLVDAGAILLGAEVERRYGLRTPVFIDLRTALYTDLTLFSLLGSSFARILERWSTPGTPQQVIGVPDTGIPLATAASLASFRKGREPFITLSVLRKQARIYPGEIVSEFVGRPDPSRETNLIDDVVASGGSLRRAVTRLKESEIPVGRIVVCVDREQGGVDALADFGIPIYALFNLAEIGAFCKERKLI